MKGVDISLHERRFPLNPSPGEIADALTFVEGKQTILLTFRALLNKGQLALAGQLTAAGRDGLVVATDVPYEVDSMPQWVNAAATFDPSRLAMQALAAVLAGEAAALGKPPVQIG